LQHTAEPEAYYTAAARSDVQKLDLPCGFVYLSTFHVTLRIWKKLRSFFFHSHCGKNINLVRPFVAVFHVSNALNFPSPGGSTPSSDDELVSMHLILTVESFSQSGCGLRRAVRRMHRISYCAPRNVLTKLFHPRAIIRAMDQQITTTVRRPSAPARGRRTSSGGLRNVHMRSDTRHALRLPLV
jgi:hypothetical protein